MATIGAFLVLILSGELDPPEGLARLVAALAGEYLADLGVWVILERDGCKLRAKEKRKKSASRGRLLKLTQRMTITSFLFAHLSIDNPENVTYRFVAGRIVSIMFALVAAYVSLEFGNELTAIGNVLANVTGNATSFNVTTA